MVGTSSEDGQKNKKPVKSILKSTGASTSNSTEDLSVGGGVSRPQTPGNERLSDDAQQTPSSFYYGGVGSPRPQTPTKVRFSPDTIVVNLPESRVTSYWERPEDLSTEEQSERLNAQTEAMRIKERVALDLEVTLLKQYILGEHPVHISQVSAENAFKIVKQAVNDGKVNDAEGNLDQDKLEKLYQATKSAEIMKIKAAENAAKNAERLESLKARISNAPPIPGLAASPRGSLRINSADAAFSSRRHAAITEENESDEERSEIAQSASCSTPPSVSSPSSSAPRTARLNVQRSFSEDSIPSSLREEQAQLDHQRIFTPNYSGGSASRRGSRFGMPTTSLTIFDEAGKRLPKTGTRLDEAEKGLPTDVQAKKNQAELKK